MTPRSPRQPAPAESPIEMATPKRPKSPMRGLSIVRGPDAEGRWYWRYRTTDGDKLITLWAGWATPSQAKAEAIAAAASPSSRGAVEDPRPATVRELLRLWLRSMEERITNDVEGQLADQVRASSFRTYAVMARQIAPPEDYPRHGGPLDLGDILLTTLEESHLRRWRDGSGLAPKTIHHATMLLRTAWRWARDRGHIDRDCPRVATSKRTTRAKPTPTPGEVNDLVEAAPRWLRIGMLLIATTGARVGEVAALSLDRVILDDTPRVFLWGKGRAGRWVGISPGVAAELKTWLAGREQGRKDARPDMLLGVGIASAAQALRGYLTKATEGGVHLTPHAMRRMASTTLIKNGVDPMTYEAVMGHSWEMGKAEYASSDEPRLRAAVDLLQLPRGQVLQFTGTATGTASKNKR